MLHRSREETFCATIILWHLHRSRHGLPLARTGSNACGPLTKLSAGPAPGRRWVTEELNHALILRLASEFQGFARDLHDESGLFVARSLAPGNQQLQDSLRVPYTRYRKIDQGNADPGTLGNDFGLFDMSLWPELQARYPAYAKGWNEKLSALNMARNGIAHDDGAKITRVQGAGWPLTLRSVDRWKSSLDELARAMDRVVGGHLKLRYGTSP